MLPRTVFRLRKSMMKHLFPGCGCVVCQECRFLVESCQLTMAILLIIGPSAALLLYLLVINKGEKTLPRCSLLGHSASNKGPKQIRNLGMCLGGICRRLWLVDSSYSPQSLVIGRNSEHLRSAFLPLISLWGSFSSLSHSCSK